MRFVFTVQGEGRGHFTQSLSLAAILKKHGHEIVAVLVGKSDSRQIPQFYLDKIGAPVFEFVSPDFTTVNEQKRPNWLLTVVGNIFQQFNFRNSILYVKAKIEEYKPDMVINFYEVITGMTFATFRLDKKLNIKLVSIAHQYILLNGNFKTSTEHDIKYYLLQMFSKLTCQRSWKILALSFREIAASPEDNIFTVPPLLRQEIFEHTPKQGNYIHGYMLNAGYYNEILDWHKKNPEIPLRFFWDKKDADDVTIVDDNLILYRLNDELFIESMANSMAYSTTSGFESICEALYYRKPTLMIPVHVEQEFNAYDAGLSGAGISSHKFDLSKLIEFIPSYQPDENFKEWVESAEKVFLKELGL